MNPVLQQILDTKQVLDADGQARDLHSNIPPAQCRIIQAWLRQSGARRVLEIGMAYGLSSLFLAEALAESPAAAYHIIDPFQASKWDNIGRLNLDRAGHASLYVLHEDYSEFCLPRLLQEGHTFGFALIDGKHTFDHSLLDFFYVNRMLRVGGVVVFDDYQLPAIQRVVAHVSTYDCYERLPLPKGVNRAANRASTGQLLAKARRLMSGGPFQQQFSLRRLLRAGGPRLVALRKIAADERPWNWHKDF